MEFFKLIRFPNLLIIVVIQYILQYHILRPNILQTNLELALSHNLFFLLVISTVIIAATGYIINDIVDVEIDKINKPQSMIVGKIISVKHAWQIYWVMLIIGFLISLYVAYRIDNLPLVLMYPAAVALLALYSLKLKQQVFIGNFVVALFSALVTGIILFAERAAYIDLKTLSQSKFLLVSYIFFGYMIFSILSSLYREIVKDIEDIEGDRQQDCKTIPTVLGIKASKTIALFFAVATLILLIPWIYHLASADKYIATAGMSLLVLLPLIYSIWKLLPAQDSKTFHHISTVIKGLMAGGIVNLLLL